MFKCGQKCHQIVWANFLPNGSSSPNGVVRVALDVVGANCKAHHCIFLLTSIVWRALHLRLCCHFCLYSPHNLGPRITFWLKPDNKWFSHFLPHEVSRNVSSNDQTGWAAFQRLTMTSLSQFYDRNCRKQWREGRWESKSMPKSLSDFQMALCKLRLSITRVVTTKIEGYNQDVKCLLIIANLYPNLWSLCCLRYFFDQIVKGI